MKDASRMLARAKVRNARADVRTEAGKVVFDMHVHTRFSDSYSSVRKVMEKAEKLGIGLAITDHNEIRGVIRALRVKSDVAVIPGIEVSVKEGPHVLVYFKTLEDLKDFYVKHIYRKKSKNPHTNTNLHMNELMRVCRNYDCLSSLAHPYSMAYAQVPKNIKRGFLDPAFLTDIDAIEAMNGAMSKKSNHNATLYAEKHDKAITGGSDAHSLFEVGKVVVYAEAKDTADFLDKVKAKQAFIVGKPIGKVKKIPTIAKTAQKHMRYLIPTLKHGYDEIIIRNTRYHKPIIIGKIKDISTNSLQLIRQPQKIPKIAYKPIKIRFKDGKGSRRKL